MNTYEPQWRIGPSGELIYPNQVHIWRAYLDVSETQREELQEILSADELDRAKRFHFEQDRNRFITTRGILRRILGKYLGEQPYNLKFEYTAKGKPVLSTDYDSHTLRFNISHSYVFALYAVTLCRNVGIDIERIREDVAIWEIAKKFFSQGEISSLEKTHENRVHELFFQFWTRKESILKAKGEGISFPMEKVDVTLIGEKILSPFTLPGDEDENMYWFVKDLFPAPGYAAAVAVEGCDCDLSYLHYSV
jgi:4'-phosphopantetheinyl transferase